MEEELTLAEEKWEKERKEKEEKEEQERKRKDCVWERKEERDKTR